jgi:hypothetical protein
MRIAVTLCLVGCAPTIMSTTPRSITVNLRYGSLGEATAIAEEHCGEYGRDAEFVPDAQADGAATFKCVDRPKPERQRPMQPGTTIDPFAAHPAQATRVDVAPRGFYCSMSATASAAGFCVRDKAECARIRDVSAAAVPDLSACALTESAWCDGDRCFPAADVCRQRSGGNCSEQM